MNLEGRGCEGGLWRTVSVFDCILWTYRLRSGHIHSVKSISILSPTHPISLPSLRHNLGLNPLPFNPNE